MILLHTEKNVIMHMEFHLNYFLMNAITCSFETITRFCEEPPVVAITVLPVLLFIFKSISKSVLTL